MVVALAYSNDNDTGLSDEDIRTATALIHCRFRGHFSGISRERSSDGGTALIVLGTTLAKEPLMTIERLDGRCVITLASPEQVFEADRVDKALDLVHERLPRATAL